MRGDDGKAGASHGFHRVLSHPALQIRARERGLTQIVTVNVTRYRIGLEVAGRA